MVPFQIFLFKADLDIVGYQSRLSTFVGKWTIPSISILRIICSLVFCKFVQCCTLIVVCDPFGTRQETFTKLTESTGKAGQILGELL